MDHIIRKGIDWCFPSEVWRTVAWSVLSMEDSGKCGTLQWMTLKSIMRRRMKGGYYEKTLFSLIFDEPVLLDPFVAPLFNNYVPRPTFLQKVRKLFKRKKKKEYRPTSEEIQKIKEDPEVLLKIMETNHIYSGFWFDVIIGRHELEIKLMREVMTKASHPTDKEYDTQLATKFLKFALSRRLISVLVIVKGEGHLDIDSMRTFMNNFIDSVPRVVPENGWRAEIAKGERKVYRKQTHWPYEDRQTYEAHFWADETFELEYEQEYWGYVE